MESRASSVIRRVSCSFAAARSRCSAARSLELAVTSRSVAVSSGRSSRLARERSEFAEPSANYSRSTEPLTGSTPVVSDSSHAQVRREPTAKRGPH